VAIALPLVAGGISVWKDDWTGVKQLGVVTLATVGTSYGLNHITHEWRPDHSDYHSRPIRRHWHSRRPRSFGTVMAGNMAYQPMRQRRLSAIAVSIRRSIIGTTSWLAPVLLGVTAGYSPPNIIVGMVFTPICLQRPMAPMCG
jgi:hypothetical protein